MWKNLLKTRLWTTPCSADLLPFFVMNRSTPISIFIYQLGLHSILRSILDPTLKKLLVDQLNSTKGAFFWDYSGIGILGIDGISVLLGAIPFSEWMEYHSVHSAPGSRMNRMEGMRFTRNRQNTRSFGNFLAGNPTRPPAAGFRLKKLEWK